MQDVNLDFHPVLFNVSKIFNFLGIVRILYYKFAL